MKVEVEEDGVAVQEIRKQLNILLFIAAIEALIPNVGERERGHWPWLRLKLLDQMYVCTTDTTTVLAECLSMEV